MVVKSKPSNQGRGQLNKDMKSSGIFVHIVTSLFQSGLGSCPNTLILPAAIECSSWTLVLQLEHLSSAYLVVSLKYFHAFYTIENFFT